MRSNTTGSAHHLPTDNVPVAPGVVMAQNRSLSSYFADRTVLGNTKQDRELLEELLRERRGGGTV